MILLNARMSERSFRRWRRFPGIAAELLGAFDLALAQAELQGERLRLLGARDVATVGDLKSAASPLPADGAALDRLRAAIGTRTFWLAASTHPGEEDVAAAVHRALASAPPRSTMSASCRP